MFEKKRYFYEVYKEKSFSRAAQKLFISQPSLSAIISREEKKIGTPIFDRSTSPISLTPMGEQYIRCCEQLFLIEDSFQEYLNDTEELTRGQLCIGSTHLFMSNILPEIISVFSRRYPDVQLELIDLDSDELKAALTGGTIDLVIDNNELNPATFDCIPLGAEQLFLAVPKSMEINEELREERMTYEDILKKKFQRASAKSVDLRRFQDIPFILMHKGYDTRIRTDQIFSDNELHPPIPFEMNQLSAVFSIISSGIGASFISDTLIKKSPLTSDYLYYYKVEHRATMRSVFIQKKRNKYSSRAAKEFIRLCLSLQPFN